MSVHSKLTVQQVAAIEGVSDSVVYRWIHSKALHAYEYPGDGKKQSILRIDPDDLEEFRQQYSNRRTTKKM